MSHFSNLGRSGLRGFVLSFLVAGTWLSGCGDDPDPAAPPSSGGKGGSAGTAGSGGKGGSAGTMTGGSAGTMTGGSAGTTTGGSAGTTTGGSAGTTTGGSAGTGGEAGSEGGMTNGGEGGMAQGAQGGEPAVGGEGGGTTSPSCISANFSIMHESTDAANEHTHLPLGMMLRNDFIDMINTGSPLTIELPEDGNNAHTHTLTFTAMQLTTLRNGGALAMDKESSQENGHTHFYSIECEP